MHYSKVLFTSLATLAGASAKIYHKFPITNAVTKDTAENKMKSKLMSKAKPLTRKLEDADAEVVIDLTGYSIVFEKCQYVKFYNVGEDDGGNDQDGGDVMSTNKFVIFKLCNSDSCSSGCNYDYGEYVVDMDTYVAALTAMKEESIENMCDQCQENCQQDDDAAQYDDDSCQSCMNECNAYETLEDNGYGDASQFVECGGAQADDDAQYSIGAYCSDDGYKISIGVFTDEYCSQLVDGLDAASFLGYTGLSDHILRATYDTDCVSCLVEPEDDDAYRADDYEDETAEMCQELYDAAGKCESPTSFSGGYLDYYSSQASNEEVICTFISSLDSGTYDQSGEIMIGDGGVTSVSGGFTTTGGQKFFLTVLMLATGGLAAYAAMLHQQITGGSTMGLSQQGGAIA